MNKDLSAMFSVILPACGREAVFKKALQSIKLQTYKEFKCYVVDDGSKESLERAFFEIVKEDKRFFFHRFKRNEGVSAARNFAIEQGEEKWITFLDSDDYWLPEKLAKQNEAIVKNQNCVFFETRSTWLRNGSKVSVPNKYRCFSGDVFKKNLQQCVVATSAITIRRDVFQWFDGFNPLLRSCEDYELWLRVVAFFPLCVVPQELTVRQQGIAPQLSLSSGPLDFYRIEALLGIENFFKNTIKIVENYTDQKSKSSDEKVQVEFLFQLLTRTTLLRKPVILMLENYNDGDVTHLKKNTPRNKNYRDNTLRWAMNNTIDDSISALLVILRERFQTVRVQRRIKLRFVAIGAFRRKRIVLALKFWLKLIISFL